MNDRRADVFVYFDSGAKGGLGARDMPGPPNIVRLAKECDSWRRISACNSCDVNGAGGRIETPVLTGQHRVDLVTQAPTRTPTAPIS